MTSAQPRERSSGNGLPLLSKLDMASSVLWKVIIKQLISDRMPELCSNGAELFHQSEQVFIRAPPSASQARTYTWHSSRELSRVRWTGWDWEPVSNGVRCYCVVSLWSGRKAFSLSPGIPRLIIWNLCYLHASLGGDRSLCCLFFLTRCINGISFALNLALLRIYM